MKATMYMVTVSLVAAALAVGPGAMAQGQGVDYAALEYTAIISDAADHVGMWDIREIALAEPGDESIVFRITADDWSVNGQATGSIDVFFDAGGSGYRSGVGSGGGPTSTNPFDSCQLEGSTAYCVFAYDSLDVTIGDQITNTRAISYMGVAQDYAPGGLYVPDGLSGGRGDDYTITGGAAADEGPVLVFGDLNGAGVDVSLDLSNATNDTYVYNWSRAATGPVEIGYKANLTAGNASVLVVDGANNTILEAVLTAAGEAGETVVAEDAADGNWTITVAFTDAMGRFSLAIADHEAPEMSPAVDGNATAEPDNGTALGNETADEGGLGIPGFETMALVVAGAIAMAFVSRRRR